MRKLLVVGFLGFLVACGAAINKQSQDLSYPSGIKTWEDSLRYIYSQSKDKWPVPFIDSGIVWAELDVIPESPLKEESIKYQGKVELGKVLFFDPRLSGSKKISCASCHIPELSWTDGREKSIGHNDLLNTRNAPSILNTWFYKNLFWDGRSHSLEDQAFSPINSEIEMHSSMPDVIRTIRAIPGYPELFQKAFDTPEITPETLTEALAVFQRTVVSGKADFDRFLEGNPDAMSEAALRGLHLFRTKARCMNCHHGALFTDNSFHNTGFAFFGTEHEDLGRYNVTQDPNDAGKFRTPSLRDVMRTGPWMHNGLFADMEGIINMYNAGMPQPKPKAGQENDPMFPKTDPLIKELNLTRQEKEDLLAFLQSISELPLKVRAPELPGKRR